LTTKFKDNERLAPLEEKAGPGEEPLKKFPITLLIIDKESGQPIQNASVNFSSISPRYKSLNTDKNGYISEDLNNRYKASIYAYGYRPENIVFSLGCDDSTRTIYLTKGSPDDKSEADFFHDYEAANPIKTEEELEDLSEDETISILAPFSAGNYKPNNIVFLLDVSISMIDHNRIVLLKTAITQLVNLLRPADNLSIIVFSEDTQLLIEPTFLDEPNRKRVIKEINAVKAGGMTNGGKGLKLAYKLMQVNYDSKKNNQVLLATDGALGAYMKHEDMVELVKKNAAFTRTSVVTLNGYNWSKIFMHEIAQAGEGKIIAINTEQEAKLVLVREIKANSIIEGE